MKVPIMYKSSERYKAGTDIVYDDGSKLQYPPFIYAVAESGDSGGDGGDDEEGEDTMIVIFDNDTATLNKSFKDMKDAVEGGKIVIAKIVNLDDDTGYSVHLLYLVDLTNESPDMYYATFGTVNINIDDDSTVASSLTLFAETETENMYMEQPNEEPNG